MIFFNVTEPVSASPYPYFGGYGAVWLSDRELSGPQHQKEAKKNIFGNQRMTEKVLARVVSRRSQDNRLTFEELVTSATGITALLWAAGTGRLGRVQGMCRGTPESKVHLKLKPSCTV